MKKFFAKLALLLAVVAACTHAATYYVSALGNDTNTGLSIPQAWATIARVNLATFAAGDSVLFRAGDTFSGNLIFTESGTASSPLTIGSFGAGRGTINAGTGNGILFTGGGIVVRDLIVLSPSRLLNTGSGVLFSNNQPGNTKLNFVRVLNVQAHSFGVNGIEILGNAVDGSQSGYTNVVIYNSVAFDNGLTGILVFGENDPTSVFAHSNVYIGNSVAHDNPGISGYQNHSGDGIFLEDVDGGTIEYSLAYNNGTLSDFAGGGPIGIWAAIANNITIQHCESHHNHGAIDGGGFDFDGGTTNSLMQYNYSHDNDGNGYLVYNYVGAPLTVGNDTVRYNISENDGVKSQASIDVGGITTGPTEIYNNTFYNSTGRVVFSNEGSKDVHFRNNILVSAGTTLLIDAFPVPGSVLQGNDYWSMTGVSKFYWKGAVYLTYAGWRLASQQETLNGANTGLAVNPLLVNAGGGGTLNNPWALNQLNAYRLQVSSPVIEKALDLAFFFGITPGWTDFYGVVVPQNTKFDMGAAESLPFARMPQ